MIVGVVEKSGVKIKPQPNFLPFSILFLNVFVKLQKFII